METKPAKSFNPYVGPRPFEQRHKNRFFGRDREISELLSLIIAHRVLVIYAQSGAGKTSLVNAGLIPQLEDEGFEILPRARVQGLIPKEIQPKEIANLYVFNTLMSWAAAKGNIQQLKGRSLADFLNLRPHHLDKMGLPSPRLLIFDQFEELFNFYPERWKDRVNFFTQVAEALEGSSLLLQATDLCNVSSLAAKLYNDQNPLSEYLRERFTPEVQRLICRHYDSTSPPEKLHKILVDELNRLMQGEKIYDKDRVARISLAEATQKLAEQNPQGRERLRLNRLLLEDAYPNEIKKHIEGDPLLRVVFVIREDHLAQLDPYATILPEGFQARFHLERLQETAALLAIKGPLSGTGRSFAPEVAEALVTELLKSRTVTITGETEESQGQYIEPVQLQVVCRRLWSSLPPDVKVIEQTHLQFGDVNRALATFYEEAIQVTTQKEGINEEKLRHWFEKALITPMGTRGTVYRDEKKGETGGIPNSGIDVLEDQHIIRAENWAGIRWYELTHDRFIEPILTSNREWFEIWRQTHRNPLAEAAREWQRLNYDEGALFSGAQLEEAIAWEKQHAGEVEPLERKFLEDSIALREHVAQEKEAQRRRELEAAQKLANEAKAREFEWIRAQAAEARAKEHARRARILRVLVALSVVALLVAVWASLRFIEQRNAARTLSARLLAQQAQNVITDKPQLGLLLAAESVGQSPQDAQGQPVAADTLVSLQRALTMTAGIPLQDQNGKIVTDTVAIGASADGHWLAAGGKDGRVHVWQFATGESEIDRSTNAGKSVPVHKGEVTVIAFSPDNHWLASGGENGAVGVLDLQAKAGKLTEIPLGQPSARIQALAFHPSESWLAASTTQGDIWRIDLTESAAWEPVRLLVNPDRAVATLVFSPQGQWLATVDISDTLRLWPLAAAVPLHDSRLLSQGKNGVVAFSPDGRWLVAASKGDPLANLFAISQQSPTLFALPGHQKGVQAISFSPDGRRLAIGSGDGGVRLWDMGYFNVAVTKLSDQKAPAIPPRPRSGNGQVTPTPKMSASPVETKSIIPEIDPLLLPAHDKAVLALAFRADQIKQTWLVTSGEDRTVKVWLEQDLETPQYALYGHDGSIRSAAFGSQPGWLFTHGDDGTVRAWDLSVARAPESVDHLSQQELQHWLAVACSRAGRTLTPEERVEYLGEVEVKAYCDLTK